jgi:hypothetical protein
MISYYFLNGSFRTPSPIHELLAKIQKIKWLASYICRVFPMPVCFIFHIHLCRVALKFSCTNSLSLVSTTNSMNRDIAHASLHSHHKPSSDLLQSTIIAYSSSPTCIPPHFLLLSYSRTTSFPCVFHKKNAMLGVTPCAACNNSYVHQLRAKSVKQYCASSS